MCKFCSLEKLDTANFDSFFQGASTQGYKSMVCKYCSTTFLTDFVFLQTEPKKQLPPSFTEAKENGFVLLSC